MYEERLTQRIRNLERKESGRDGGDLSYIVNSIINHLQRILNTRQGSVPIADDYGMPDFTNYQGLGMAEQAKDIADIVKNIILKYEPRLGSAQVAFEPDKTTSFPALSFKPKSSTSGTRSLRGTRDRDNSEGKVRVSK